MDQTKIGMFLKKLRNEKGLTQEQLAESIGVSSRSVSRWENGVNMPDLSLVIEMAKLFNVSIGELLDGERKEDIVDKKTEESLVKAAEYGNDEKLILTRRLRVIFIVVLIFLSVFMYLEIQGLREIQMYDNIASFALGLVFGGQLVGIIYTSRYMLKIREFKKRLLNHN